MNMVYESTAIQHC